MAHAVEEINRLRAIAERTETRLLNIPFSESEKESLKDQLVDVSIKLSAKEESFKQVKQAWKEEIDPLKNERIKLLKQIRTGHHEEERDVYITYDHEAGMVEVYDSESGALVESRRMLPDEKKTIRMHFDN